MIAALVGGGGRLSRLWVGTPGGRYRWDRLKLRLPVVGELIHKATLARFSRSFALSGKSGVPIVQALAVVASVVDNAYLEARIQQMRDGIERGESILRTAVAAGVFTPVVLQMVAVGEETGEIDDLMAEIADMYEREVDDRGRGPDRQDRADPAGVHGRAGADPRARRVPADVGPRHGGAREEVSGAR